MSRAAANPDRPLALIAFGGNALAPKGGAGTQDEQVREAAVLARELVELWEQHRLLLVHGNGPQVGQVLVQVAAGLLQVPPWSLDACVAATQGIIGYLLEAAIRSRASEVGATGSVSSLVTLVEVDPDDPALAAPTKPVGPYYSEFVARHHLQYGNQEWLRLFRIMLSALLDGKGISELTIETANELLLGGL